MTRKLTAEGILMRDIASPKWIKAKGLLFLFLGLLSATLLFFEKPTLRVALLLVLAVWGFCRFYYFAFYVIERYVDADYRFSGLLSFARYLIGKPAAQALSESGMAGRRDAGATCWYTGLVLAAITASL
jgi:hypothetical protein